MIRSLFCIRNFYLMSTNSVPRPDGPPCSHLTDKKPHLQDCDDEGGGSPGAERLPAEAGRCAGHQGRVARRLPRVLRARVHGVGHGIARRRLLPLLPRTGAKKIALQSCAAYRSRSFEDEYLGSSHGWWAATVATYCPSRPGELPKFLLTKPCE